MANTPMRGSPTINVLGFTLVVGSLKNNINPYTWVAIWIVKDIIIFYDKCGSLLHEILKIRQKYSLAYSKYMSEINMLVLNKNQQFLQWWFPCMRMWGGCIMAG